MINIIGNKSKIILLETCRLPAHYDKDYINCLATWVHCSFLEKRPVQQQLQQSSLPDYNSTCYLTFPVNNQEESTMYPFHTRLHDNVNSYILGISGLYNVAEYICLIFKQIT